MSTSLQNLDTVEDGLMKQFNIEVQLVKDLAKKPKKETGKRSAANTSEDERLKEQLAALQILNQTTALLLNAIGMKVESGAVLEEQAVMAGQMTGNEGRVIVGGFRTAGKTPSAKK